MKKLLLLLSTVFVCNISNAMLTNKVQKNRERVSKKQILRMLDHVHSNPTLSLKKIDPSLLANKEIAVKAQRVKFEQIRQQYKAK